MMHKPQYIAFDKTISLYQKYYQVQACKRDQKLGTFPILEAQHVNNQHLWWDSGFEIKGSQVLRDPVKSYFLNQQMKRIY